MSHKLKFFAAFTLCLLPESLRPQIPAQFVVWNVGQGSWHTLITPQRCIHFDMGGEFYPQSIKRYCAYKQNYLILTHLDSDHIRFIKKFQNHIEYPLCLIRSYKLPKFLKKSKQWLRKLKPCENLHWSFIKTIFNPRKHQWHKIKAKANDNSYVYQFLNCILIPGDSTKRAEKFWKYKSRSVRYLILGHHGSKTSTSLELLKSLPQLSYAIVSARKKRYGHPHRDVVSKVREHNLVLLRTEHWGHIAIPITKGCPQTNL